MKTVAATETTEIEVTLRDGSHRVAVHREGQRLFDGTTDELGDLLYNIARLRALQGAVGELMDSKREINERLKRAQSDQSNVLMSIADGARSRGD